MNERILHPDSTPTMEHHTEDDVGQLQASTLLFYGDDSIIFEPVLSAGFESPGADIQQIQDENSGHNVHHDQAELVNEEIPKFFLTSYR